MEKKQSRDPEVASVFYDPAFDKLAKWLLYSQIIATTFLQKIAVPTGGKTQIFLGIFVMCAATALGILSGRLELRGARLKWYLLMAGGMTLIQLVNDRDFSIMSLTLLLLIHFPYVCAIKHSYGKSGIELYFYQKVMAVLAVLGVIQFLLQFVIGWKYAFFIDAQLPAQMVMAGFNNLNVIRMGTHVYKSNGVFLLEPAMFCQFLAISIVIEMIYFKRMRMVMLYLVGILTTYSGTGLILLGLLVPFYLIRKRQFILLATIVLGLGLVVAIAPLVGLDAYVARVSEFSDNRTSGYARFISIFPILHDFVLQNTNTLLMGWGAGNDKTFYALVDYELHPPGWGKLWLEYGLIGLILYIIFMGNMIWRANRTGYLKAALTIEFFFDNYVLVPTVHNLILALLMWPATEREPSLKLSRNPGDEPFTPSSSLHPGTARTEMAGNASSA